MAQCLLHAYDGRAAATAFSPRELIRKRPCLLYGVMSFESDLYRRREREQREEAERAKLPTARLRAQHAAERWADLAEQAERTSAASARRECEKAARDVDRMLRPDPC